MRTAHGMWMVPFILTVVLAVATEAHSADEQKWDFVAFDEGGGQLFYGIPESDALSTIAFICESKSTRVVVVTGVLPVRPRKGQAIKTTVSNGTTIVVYDGKVGFSGEEGDGTFFVEASAAKEPKTVDILKWGATLTVSIPGKQESIKLRGSARPLARFEAACFR